jgi:hypothetical protein
MSMTPTEDDNFLMSEFIVLRMAGSSRWERPVPLRPGPGLFHTGAELKNL